MGEWEGLFCADCGALIQEASFRRAGQGRIEIKPRHFYTVGIGSDRERIVCPACFVTTRIPPSAGVLHAHN